MKDIAIYGAGGLGKELVTLINEINQSSPEWNFLGFFDDGLEKGTKVSHFGNVLGGINELNNWISSLSIVLAFGNPKTREIAHQKINNPYILFPNLIHPNFFIGDKETFKIGMGNIIQGACVATTDISIGNFNIFNGYVVLGHDVSIGNYNVLMPGSRISGEVKIGNSNLLGADCFIKQELIIGNDVTISPLSALLTKPKNGKTYIGNPAKLFKF